MRCRAVRCGAVRGPLGAVTASRVSSDDGGHGGARGGWRRGHPLGPALYRSRTLPVRRACLRSSRPCPRRARALRPPFAPHPAACARESGAFVVVATLAGGPARTSGDILPVAALPPCLPLGRVDPNVLCTMGLGRPPARPPARTSKTWSERASLRGRGDVSSVCCVWARAHLRSAPAAACWQSQRPHALLQRAEVVRPPVYAVASFGTAVRPRAALACDDVLCGWLCVHFGKRSGRLAALR